MKFFLYSALLALCVAAVQAQGTSGAIPSQGTSGEIPYPAPADYGPCKVAFWNQNNANGDGYVSTCSGNSLFLLQNRPHTAWGGPCKAALGAFDGDHDLAERCICMFCSNAADFVFPILGNWAAWPTSNAACVGSAAWTPSCPAVANTDCAVTWSCDGSCTASSTINTAQSGTGAACETQHTCNAGEGACPANVDCAVTWSCDASCTASSTVNTAQSGTGAACETQHTCNAGEGACPACSDPSCDACASDTCTDCSNGFILNVAGACVSSCPLGQYGVVDTDFQCTACNLRLDSGDIEKTWMNTYTILKGEVTVKIQEELEWTIENDKPTLSGNTASCSAFAWSYAEQGCDYREWTGQIGIYELLQCSSATTKELVVVGNDPKISQTRVEFQMLSSRNVEYYMAGEGTPTSITTTRTTLMPMLFDFQKTIVVQSADITVTSMYFAVTEVVTTLTDTVVGVPLTDVEKDEISKNIATFFNFPSAAIKFTFAESGNIVVTAQVPGDVSERCQALTFTSFSKTGVVCTLGQDFASIREVTERSVVSVKITDELYAQAKLKVHTDVKVPFELKNPQHVGTKSFTYSAFTTTTTGTTCDVASACVKTFEWTLTDNNISPPVCTFSDNYEVQFDLVCSPASIAVPGFKCPLVGDEKIATTISLESGNHCPNVEKAVDISLLATALVSNRVDPGGDVPIDSFLNTQKLKFHSDVRSNDAGLKDATFITISIASVNRGVGAVDLTLLNEQATTADGTVLKLLVSNVIGSSTDPKLDSSVLSPSFTLVADADKLGLSLQGTAAFKVTATIAAVYKAAGVRRRALLQVSYDASTETSRTVIISAEEPAMQVLEESAAHGSVSAGFLLALLSAYTAFALYF